MKSPNDEEMIRLVWELSGKGLTEDERALLAAVGNWRSDYWPYPDYISSKDLEKLGTALQINVARQLKAIQSLCKLGWLTDEVKIDTPLRYWISTAGRHRKPTTEQRKAIVRQLRTVGTSKREHVSAKKTTGEGHKRMVEKFIPTLFHAAKRMRDSKRLREELEAKSKELGQRDGRAPDMYPYLPKPWRGKAGQKAGTETREGTAADLGQRARDLHAAEPDLTYLQIAERLGLTDTKERKPGSLEQRIYRYVKKKPSRR